MRIRILAMGMLLINLSCTKESSVNPVPTPTELLTRGAWIFNSFGYDTNSNNKIDSNEEMVEECQEDNRLYYYKDGSGLFDEHLLTCGTGIEREPFTWKLVNAEKAIDLFYETLHILKLTGEELVLCKELNLADGSSVKMIMCYTH